MLSSIVLSVALAAQPGPGPQTMTNPATWQNSGGGVGSGWYAPAHPMHAQWGATPTTGVDRGEWPAPPQP